jgi:hypothetical protein
MVARRLDTKPAKAQPGGGVAKFLTALASRLILHGNNSKGDSLMAERMISDNALNRIESLRDAVLLEGATARLQDVGRAGWGEQDVVRLQDVGRAGWGEQDVVTADTEPLSTV